VLVKFDCFRAAFIPFRIGFKEVKKILSVGITGILGLNGSDYFMGLYGFVDMDRGCGHRKAGSFGLSGPLQGGVYVGVISIDRFGGSGHIGIGETDRGDVFALVFFFAFIGVCFYLALAALGGGRVFTFGHEKAPWILIETYPF
jgi:hypothetical protein